MFNTISLFLLSTIPQLLLALGLAALLDRGLRGRMFWRAGVLLPNVISVAAVALVFAQLFGRDFGIVNWVLGFFGVDPIDWRANTWSSHIAVSVMVIWRWTGYNALLYLAAMQSVPRDRYESAMLDGASPWRMFWSMTVRVSGRPSSSRSSRPRSAGCSCSPSHSCSIPAARAPGPAARTGSSRP